MEVKPQNGNTAFGENIRIIPILEWLAEGAKLFGDDKKEWQFVCSHCKQAQSIGDFVELKKLKISDVNPETEVSGAKALRTPPTSNDVGIRAGDIL